MIKRILKRIKGIAEVYFQLYILKKRKLNVGSAEIKLTTDWIPTNIDILNITVASDWHRLFHGTRLDYIMAEHVWEHLTDEDALLANKNCFDYLKKGGRLRLAVPDGNKPDKDYIDWVKVGGSGDGAFDHKILYTYDVMKKRLEHAGFEVELLEYWDEKGEFHYTDWTNEPGLIRRSRRYDERNVDEKLAYTSLIVDAIKR
jgi:predicted SAM-dependent methyltransferase